MDAEGVVALTKVGSKISKFPIHYDKIIGKATFELLMAIPNLIGSPWWTHFELFA
jgi:hypothetical protein